MRTCACAAAAMNSSGAATARVRACNALRARTRRAHVRMVQEYARAVGLRDAARLERTKAEQAVDRSRFGDEVSRAY